MESYGRTLMCYPSVPRLWAWALHMTRLRCERVERGLSASAELETYGRPRGPIACRRALGHDGP